MILSLVANSRKVPPSGVPMGSHFSSKGVPFEFVDGAHNSPKS